MSTMIRSASRYRGQRGQAAVMLALLGIVLFAVGGLVVDGAQLYLSRRVTQNAADAGALAGTQVLADGTKTNAQVLGAIQGMVAANGADPGQLECSYGGSSGDMGAVNSYDPSSLPPAAATGVRVVARRAVSLVFGFLWGGRQTAVGAQAFAAFGTSNALKAGGSIFPVGLEDDVLDGVAVGDRIRIWDDSKVTDEAGNTVGGDRGWLNLDYVYSADDPNGRTASKSMSNSKLTGWVLAGKDPPVLLVAGRKGELDGDFIDGEPGVRNSTVLKASLRVGATVIVPIYDTVYTPDQLAAENLTVPDLGWPNGGLFHIVGFARVQITDVSHGADKYLEAAILPGTTVSPGSLPVSLGAGHWSSDSSPLAITLTDGFWPRPLP